jgi:hypothetical protein
LIENAVPESGYAKGFTNASAVSATSRQPLRLPVRSRWPRHSSRINCRPTGRFRSKTRLRSLAPPHRHRSR